MRPKDFQIPFSWDDRRVLLSDRVLFVPGHCADYSTFQFPGWRHGNLFGNDHPVKIEFCSGNGEWIAHKAKSEPEFNWVAVEKRFARTKKIWSKIKNLALPNLFIICGEARLSTQLFLPECSASEIFINFPDPWPKNRHSKHRLINTEFIEQLNRILIPGGIVTFVTDETAYSQQAITTFLSTPQFSTLFEKPYYVTDWQGYGNSYFDSLWRSKGRVIHYMRFKKNE